MKKTIFTAMAILALAGAQPAMAENITVNFTPESADYEYGFRSYIDYKDNGEVWPNLYVILGDSNTNAAGDQVLASASVEYTMSQGDFSKSGTTNYNFNADSHGENHSYLAFGIIGVDGDVNVTAKITFKYSDASTPDLVEVYNGTVNLPAIKPSLNFTSSLTRKDGSSAMISYQGNVINYDGTVTYTAELYKGTTAEGTPEQTLNDASGVFTIAAIPGENYSYTVKLSVSGEGLDLEAKTATYNWEQTAELPALNYEIIPTGVGANFKYNITLASYTPDDVEGYMVSLLKAGQNPDNADWKSTTQEGEIVTTFDGQTTGIWLKAYITLKDGTQIQLQPWDKNMTLEKAKAPDVTLKVVAKEFVATSTTGGQVFYQIIPEGSAEDIAEIDHYEIWASRAGDEFMNVTNLNADETEGVFTLDALPESATTAIWVKAKAYFKNGSVGNTVQADPIDANTINVGISTIDTVSFDSEATYFDLRGVKVTNPQKGQLYIKVTPARSSKVIF